VESLPPSRSREQPVSGILVRAEQAIADAAERILREQLHRVIDTEGSQGLTTLAGTLLPQIRALVALLPQLVQQDSADNASEAAQTLGTALQERGLALPELITEGVDLHHRLLYEIARELRSSDLPLVAAMIQLSRILLEVGRNALLAYQESATASLRDLALTDSLTGLANRRAYEERIEEELLRAQRMGRSLALLLLDVDHLKQMNDTFGHAAGDQLLRAVADVLRGRTRGIDLAARIGGDEFILLLPETDRTGAMVALERLTDGISEQRIQGRTIQISAGVAVYPDDGRTEEALRTHADDDLYQTKRRRQ
jgi:diguanylate cyclase (GGDEF)-like protein